MDTGIGEVSSLPYGRRASKFAFHPRQVIDPRDVLRGDPFEAEAVHVPDVVLAFAFHIERRQPKLFLVFHPASLVSGAHGPRSSWRYSRKPTWTRFALRQPIASATAIIPSIR